MLWAVVYFHLFPSLISSCYRSITFFVFQDLVINDSRSDSCAFIRCKPNSHRLIIKQGLSIVICHDGNLGCSDEGRIIPEYLVFGGYVQHFSPRSLEMTEVEWLLGFNWWTAVVSRHSRGCLSVFALRTHQSQQDRCPSVGLSSPSAPRHAFLSVWPPRDSAPDKVVAAKSAT